MSGHVEYPEHNNDIGDWCPWSGEPWENDDTRCPAGCRASNRGDWDDDQDATSPG